MTRTRTIMAIAVAIGLAAGFIGLAGSPADARPRGDSETACVNWCFDHRDGVERNKCLNGCECYYHGDLCARSDRAAVAARAMPPDLAAQATENVTPVAPRDAAGATKRRPARTPN